MNRVPSLQKRLASVPPDMAIAPKLQPPARRRPVQPRKALLLNPFYPKDPRADQYRRRYPAPLAG